MADDLRALAEAARQVVFVESTVATSVVQGLGIVGPANGDYAPFNIIDLGHQPTAKYLAAAAEAVPGLLADRDRLKQEVRRLRKALEPFAYCPFARVYDDTPPCGGCAGCLAAAALKETP